MIRAAAKNHGAVGVVTDPGQYRAVLEELRGSGGELGDATRVRLAQEAFRRTAQYDAAIAAYLRSPAAAPSAPERQPDEFPHPLRLEAERELSLRYGENPHQTAAFYRIVGAPPVGLAGMKQLHGPELGYNNVLDFSAALGLLLEFEDPAAVVIKHTNPCGAALGRTVGEAMARAKASDPVSIYGGIVGVNRTLDMAVVKELSRHLRGDSLRAVVRARRSGGAAADEEEVPRVRAALRTPRAARAAGRVSQRAGGPARSVDRPRGSRRRGAQDGDEAGAHGGGDDGAAVCLARGQARQVQRHRAVDRDPDRRCGRRPDEPR